MHRDPISAILMKAIAIADAPENHTLKELERAATLLEYDQSIHASGRHCPELSMERMNARLLILAEAISKKAHTAGITIPYATCVLFTSHSLVHRQIHSKA